MRDKVISAEDVKRALDLYWELGSMPAVAKRLGKDQVAIQRHLKGVSTTAPSRRNEKLSPPQTSSREKLAKVVEAVAPIIEQAKPKYDPSDFIQPPTLHRLMAGR